MVVNWKQARVKVIPIVEKGRKVLGCRNILLLPGMNQVKDDDWKICEKYITQYDKKYLEIIKDVIEEKVDGKKTKKDTLNFNEFSSELSRKAIDDCFNISALEDWRKTESRADIRNLIDDKIRQIKERKFDKEIAGREE